MVQILASFDNHFIRVHGNGNGPEMVLSYFVGGWDTPPPQMKNQVGAKPLEARDEAANLYILLYKVVSVFLSVLKDLANC